MMMLSCGILLVEPTDYIVKWRKREIIKRESSILHPPPLYEYLFFFWEREILFFLEDYRWHSKRCFSFFLMVGMDKHGMTLGRDTGQSIFIVATRIVNVMGGNMEF